jgi:hypothetical protein
MDDRDGNPDALRLPCLSLLGIDDDKIVRQNYWLTDQIKNLSIQSHLDSFGETKSLESFAEINLLVRHNHPVHASLAACSKAISTTP